MPGIQPTTPQPTPQPLPQNSGTPDAAKKAEQPAKATKVATPAKTQSKPSPLKEQARDVRGQPDYNPVSITILNGAHKGKSVDLGIAINEVTHSETAEMAIKNSKRVDGMSGSLAVFMPKLGF